MAEFNGSAIPDLIECAEGAIQIMLGNGKGGFTKGPTTVLAPFVYQFATADLNGDQAVDLIVVGTAQNDSGPWGIGVSLGNGDGTFQPTVFYPAGTDSYTEYLALGDFNGDGITDVVTVGESGIWLFTGQGGGLFNPGVLIPFSGVGIDNYNFVAAADFRKNGKLDLVVSTLTGFAVLLGNGNGTFQPQQNFANPQDPGSPCTFAVGALTEGGYPAIIGNCNSLEVPVYASNGKGGFTGPTYIDIPAVTLIADVNDDGIPDLLDGTLIALGEGHGRFQAPVYYPVADADLGGGNVVTAHLRSPSLTDLVVQGGGAVSILLNSENMGFEDGLWTPLPSGALCGASANYAGGSSPGLAVNTKQGVSILLGTGSATAPFTVATSIPLSNSICLVTADLNGDGVPDLLVPYYSNPGSSLAGAVNAYLGNGNGTFTLASSTPVSVAGYVAVADFNQDGNMDFALSSNLIALGNGNGTFQTPTQLVAVPPEGGFLSIAAGDVNNDGWPDLVLTSGEEAEATITVLLNNQHGGFTETTMATCKEPFTAPCNPTSVILADVNGDGNLDLVVGQTHIGGVVVYLGNGQGGFKESASLTDVLEYPGPIMVADVNGDGIPDVVLTEDATLAVFLGKGNGTFDAPFYIGVGPQPEDLLPMNLHGQSPAAGVPDLVAPDYTGGVMVLINNTTPQ